MIKYGAMYGCSYFYASGIAVESDPDGCRPDADNRRKLGKAVAEYIKSL